MAFGIIGTEVYQQQTQLTLQNGESLTVGNYEMVFNGVERYPGPDDLLITEADVDVFYNGRFVKTLNPRTEFYTRTGQPMTIPAIRSTISEDFYVLLVNWEPTTAAEATFRVYFNPLINWVWAGGLIFVLGTLIAAWPDPRKEKVAEAKQNRVVLGAGD
jgi:cytochrome c-type biogenesis protein CcmF